MSISLLTTAYLGTITTASATAILIAGTAGMTTYLGILAATVHKAKRLIKQTTIQKIHVAFCGILTCLGLYFITTSLYRF